MYTRTFFVSALLAVGCQSENKVFDDLDPVGVSEPTPTGPGTTPGNDDTGVDTVDTGTNTETNPNGTNPGTGTTITVPTDITEDELCEYAAALVITLDPYQTPNDGRVTYCHSGSGNSYNYIDTDISSCLPHLNHPYDVFPTTGCDN